MWEMWQCVSKRECMTVLRKWGCSRPVSFTLQVVLKLVRCFSTLWFGLCDKSCLLPAVLNRYVGMHQRSCYVYQWLFNVEHDIFSLLGVELWGSTCLNELKQMQEMWLQCMHCLELYAATAAFVVCASASDAPFPWANQYILHNYLAGCLLRECVSTAEISCNRCKKCMHMYMTGSSTINKANDNL